MLKFVPKDQSGKSVMELLIVVVIVVVLVTIAVAQFGRSGANLDRQNIAREFKVSLERARFDSVKRRVENCDDMSRVVINSATSFTLYNDLNQNGTIETGSEARTVDFAARSDVTIVGDDTSFPVTFRFDRRGNVSKGPCDALVNEAASVVFCNAPCTALTANAGNSNVIFVSRTGTAAMMTGGSTIPTFANPSVSNVNSDSQVNPLLSVWDPESNTATPTPSPDPTVDPSPSMTPVVDPTVAPTIDPSTPTPTPSPFACAYGERPDETGCTCVAPMWVRANRKCQ